MTPKERLLRTLRGETVDRPPVICPGGMMNAAVSEVIRDIPGNHNCEPKAMAEAAHKVRELTGFENYGVPFCMTIEAELVPGVELSYGSKDVEPRVEKYSELDIDTLLKSSLRKGRVTAVCEAIKLLQNEEIPVIGNLTGPFSTATSILDPLEFLKMMRKKPEQVEKFLDFVLNYSLEFIEKMLSSGADLIAISDPTATGEILGKHNFEKFVIPLYQKIADKLSQKEIPFILHICGKAQTILKSLGESRANILSFDSVVNTEIAAKESGKAIMGNINTLLLDTGREETIKTHTEKALRNVAIVAPACGLSMSTPLENLKLMTGIVKNSASAKQEI